jgi:BirA family biotin operon repressor/biotin-[acetyl-CoA-carboxylase] ligase
VSGASFALLPLAAGLAAAEAVHDAAGVEPRLKWPNDLVHERKKLGGILAEAVTRAGGASDAVVGIGVNVNHGVEDLPGELRETATSIRLVTGRPGDLEALLSSLCRTLDCWYNSVIRGEREKIIRSYEQRMAFLVGGRLRAATARGGTAGIFRGLAPDGRLRLDTASGPEFLSFEKIRALEWE